MTNCLSVIISALLLLKITEIGFSVRWALVHGRDCSRDLSSALARWRKSGFKKAELLGLLKRHGRHWSPADWPITRFTRLLPLWMRSIVVNYLFRWPSLMLLQSLCVGVSGSKLVAVVGMLLLFVGIWIEIVHILSHRLNMGHMDSYFRRTVSFRLMDNDDPQAYEVMPSQVDQLREYVTLFCWLLGVVVTGYAGIYSALSTAASPSDAFHGLSGSMTLIQTLYFSVVTIGTVGYGDIYPITRIAQLAVASEILAGLTLIVLLLTVFSLTANAGHADPQ